MEEGDFGKFFSHQSLALKSTEVQWRWMPPRPKKTSTGITRSTVPPNRIDFTYNFVPYSRISSNINIYTLYLYRTASSNESKQRMPHPFLMQPQPNRQSKYSVLPSRISFRFLRTPHPSNPARKGKKPVYFQNRRKSH